jgi:elongator complex protein 1
MSGFPEFCLTSNHVPVPHENNNDLKSGLYIGLAASGKLYTVNHLVPPCVLESNVTSFTVTPHFLIFTTTSHEAVFASLAGLSISLLPENGGDIKNITSGWEKRRIERGSRIVTAVPSAMSLVLQMPRGNLETIYPRPLVMEVLKQSLDE